MTRTELEEIIERSIEHKLLEILGDPDDGRAILRSLQARLLRQRKKVAEGGRGRSLGDVARKLGLE